MRPEKLTSRFQEALSEAQSLAVGRDHNAIDPVHVLAALLAQDGGSIQPLLVKDYPRERGHIVSGRHGGRGVLQRYDSGPRRSVRNDSGPRRSVREDGGCRRQEPRKPHQGADALCGVPSGALSWRWQQRGGC